MHTAFATILILLALYVAWRYRARSFPPPPPPPPPPSNTLSTQNDPSIYETPGISGKIIDPLYRPMTVPEPSLAQSTIANPF